MEIITIYTGLYSASKNKYVISPALYYSWFGSPPLLPQIIGVAWLGHYIWPSVYDFDLVEVIQDFYRTFFEYEVSFDDATLFMEFMYGGLKQLGGDSQ